MKAVEHIDLKHSLKEKGLKVTPQRLAVYEAIAALHNHPTAEQIIAVVTKKHPSISVGTVYKVLDALVENKLVKKVKTERDVMRYDAILDSHHHLYCTETDRIEDYHDETLDRIIVDYFKRKKIRNFNVQEIKLQITGTFKR